MGHYLRSKNATDQASFTDSERSQGLGSPAPAASALAPYADDLERIHDMTNTIDVAFCQDLLTQVGIQLVEASKQAKQHQSWKEKRQYFLEANTRAEAQVRSALFQKYPAIRWSETEFELEKQRSDEFEEPSWMCDPIDGAVNFLQGLPFWSMSLCLLHQGQPQWALVYDPCQREFFTATRGDGAFLNGEPISVSQTQNLADALIAASQPTFVMKEMEDTQRTTRAIAQLMPKVGALRTLGGVSLQLAYIACGRCDGYWEFGKDLYDWLAGSLLIQEAHGVVTNIAGGDLTWGATGIIAANSVLHQQLKAEIP